MNQTPSQQDRQIEHAKYVRAYAAENYHMGVPRMGDALVDLRSVGCRESYLDVSCGKGEMLHHALAMGFGRVQGTEIVPDLVANSLVDYAEVHNLPFADNSFQVVSLFDVIEHLLPGDDENACREMKRVATSHIFVTANNKPSFNQAGDDLHINKRKYLDWHELFCEWFGDCSCIWLSHDKCPASQGWRIDL